MNPTDEPHTIPKPVAGGAAATSFNPAQQRALLVVMPHPDDESFARGGTMALSAKAGAPVTFLCGTYGDMGRRMGLPPFANRESLRDIRERELREAAGILGARVHFMGLRDKCVEFEDPQQLAASIRERIAGTAPTTLITFYPGYGVHPDHDALGQAAVLAVRGMAREERPRLLAVAVGEPAALEERLGSPHLETHIASVSELKLEALRAHRSQTAQMFRQWQEGDLDPQMEQMRRRMVEVEEFYELDPDQPTPLERAAA